MKEICRKLRVVLFLFVVLCTTVARALESTKCVIDTNVRPCVSPPSLAPGDDRRARGPSES